MANNLDIETYNRKRDFTKTKEPKGRKLKGKGDSFVVQKHSARRLHWDFRLELDGVLKSWAVPKGPSLDPGEKRLAMRTEDHPLDYGDFEGTIPAGEYGGGTVMLWDHGTWTPEEDPHRGYRAGSLKFSLQGEKLHGSWALVRIRDRRQARDDERSWLLCRCTLFRACLAVFICRFCSALFGIAETALECSHEVNDVRALGRPSIRIGILDDPLALGALLLFNQAMQRIHIAVVELGRIELAGFTLDQHRGHV
ncbi:MAG: DNA polymerase ligase N-terminal domain-containing protein, partial [Sphingomicrobium sp.]